MTNGNLKMNGKSLEGLSNRCNYVRIDSSSDCVVGNDVNVKNYRLISSFGIQ